MEIKTSTETLDKVKNYVYENYKEYKDKVLFITETEGCFRILKHKDASPLILGKSILDK
jgi:hypothetical protein